MTPEHRKALAAALNGPQRDATLHELEQLAGLKFRPFKADEVSMHRLILTDYRKSQDLRPFTIKERTALLWKLNDQWNEPYVKRIADGSEQAAAGRKLYEVLSDDERAVIHAQLISPTTL